jgi:coenzyme PQQ synthesis protein D (PqqD)
MLSTFRLRDTELDWRAVEGEVVALDRRTSNYLAVNSAGAKLWEALASGASRDQLIELLVADFTIAREVAERDTDAFLQMLSEQDLLLEV